MMSIHFGHTIDYIQAGKSSLPTFTILPVSKFPVNSICTVLGYGFVPGPKTLLASRRDDQKLLNAEGKILNEKFPVTSDDTIFLNGTLSSGIPISYSLRGGKPFKGTPGLDWRIYGVKGEIRVTATGPFLNVGYEAMNAEVFDFESDSIESVEVERDEFDLPDREEGKVWGLPSRNVGRLYKDFAEGNDNCTFEDAVERHALIEGMYKENGIEV